MGNVFVTPPAGRRRKERDDVRESNKRDSKREPERKRERERGREREREREECVCVCVCVCVE